MAIYRSGMHPGEVLICDEDACELFVTDSCACELECCEDVCECC